jgi:hypothetical protein
MLGLSANAPVPIRPPSCGVAWPSAAPALDWRQGQTRSDYEHGRSIFPQTADRGEWDDSDNMSNTNSHAPERSHQIRWTMQLPPAARNREHNASAAAPTARLNAGHDAK